MKKTRFNVETNPETGILGAADQVELFKGWIYLAEKDRMIKHKPGYGKHGVLVLTRQAFDCYNGGHRFFIGMTEDGPEFSTSASYAFCHSRVAEFEKHKTVPES